MKESAVPVLELVLLSGSVLLWHLLLNLLICPAIKDASLNLIQHLQPRQLAVRAVNMCISTTAKLGMPMCMRLMMSL